MDLTYQRLGDNVLVVTADGTVDERNVEGLMAETSRAIEGGVDRIVVDCTKVNYVSSYGLGTFVRLHKRLVERRGALVLAGVGGRLLTQLRLVRLSDVFPMFSTVDEARQASIPPPSGPSSG